MGRSARQLDDACQMLYTIFNTLLPPTSAPTRLNFLSICKADTSSSAFYPLPSSLCLFDIPGNRLLGEMSSFRGVSSLESAGMCRGSAVMRGFRGSVSVCRGSAVMRGFHSSVSVCRGSAVVWGVPQ